MPDGGRVGLQDIIAAEAHSGRVHVTYAVVENGDVLFFDIDGIQGAPVP